MTRKRMRYGVAPAAVVALSLSAVPLVATAAPAEKSAQDTSTSTPLGHAIGNAGTLLSVIRLLPGAKLPDGLPIPVPNNGSDGAPISLGFGLSTAQTNSEVDAPNSLAEAAPFGASLNGTMPSTPGSSVQSAPPDNKEPVTGGYNIPNNPLISAGLFNTSAHARYSDTLGPCVKPIAESKTVTADVSLIPSLTSFPGLPATGQLPKITKADQLDKAFDLDALRRVVGPIAQRGTTQNDSGQATTQADTDPIQDLLGPLKQLIDLLNNLNPGSADGSGLVTLPETLSTRSTVALVPLAGSKNKAVQSTSQFQAANVTLFGGTPLQLRIELASKPTLKVTSTGKKETSKVEYTKPILKVYQGDNLVYELDPDDPFKEIPLNLLPLSSLTGDQLQKLAKAGLGSVLQQAKQFGALPFFGDPAKLAGLLGLDPSQLENLDLAVVRIKIGDKTDTGVTKHKGEDNAPFSGYEIGSHATLLNVEILPTDTLSRITGTLDTADTPALPSSLAQLAFGEQQAKAYAPRDGVICATTPVTKPETPKPDDQGSPPLAYTDAAYQTLPLFWTGAGMVLAGAALVGFRPLRRALVRNRRQ